MSWLSEFAGGGGLGFLPSQFFGQDKGNSTGGSKRDGAPQALPGVNPNLTPPANYWQGNQFQIPGFGPGQQPAGPWHPPAPQGGLAGGLAGGGGMPQQGGGLAGQLGQLQGNPAIAQLLQRLMGHG